MYLNTEPALVLETQENFDEGRINDTSKNDPVSNNLTLPASDPIIMLLFGIVLVGITMVIRKKRR